MSNFERDFNAGVVSQKGKSILIGNDIEVEVVDIRGNLVCLGITAPRSVQVDRKEVREMMNAKETI